MDYIEVCHKGYCFVSCNVLNTYKIRIFKVMKGWRLSRDGTVRSWKAFQLYTLKGKDLKICCKRNVLKMTQLWSSNDRRVRGIDFHPGLSLGSAPPVPCLGWELPTCGRQQIADSLAWGEEPQVRVWGSRWCVCHFYCAPEQHGVWMREGLVSYLETMRMEIRRIFWTEILVELSKAE